MGLFDSVYIDCDCGGKAEFQSKAGECELAEYYENNIPPNIATDLIGKTSVCDRCGKTCYLNVKVLVFTNPKWR